MRVGIWGLALVLGGCFRGGGDEGGASADSSGSDGADDGEQNQCSASEVGFSPLRRLTRTQYDNAVRDLLGITGSGAGLGSDESVGPFASNSVAPPSEFAVEQYKTTAEELAEQAVQDLAALLPCDQAAVGEDACANEFIAGFGRRAFRRPLTEQEHSRAFGVFDHGRDAVGFADGIRLAVQALLQSPHFLYHAEGTGDGEPVVELTGYEVASRLSFFLWSSIPDDALLDAAEQGRLADPDEIEAETRRMLADDKAGDTIFSFHKQWLALEQLGFLEKSADVFPEFSPALADAMAVEMAKFVDYVVRADDGRLETLLTANYTFANGDLAQLYEIDAGPQFELVTVDHPRSGVLSLPSVLAVHAHADQTSPVHRGKLVRENLMCQPMPSPPPNVDDTPPDIDPDLPAKERFAQHSADPACAACHELMDPIGFGFEAYDGLGRHRTVDGNVAVDDVGEIVGSGEIDGAFKGVVELGEVLSSSEVVRQCMADQWFRFALGRYETPQDDCSRENIYAAFEGSDYNIRELVVAITRSDAMRFRRVEP